MRCGNGIGGHKDSTEEKTAHQQLLPTVDRTEAGQVEQGASDKATGNDGQHDAPTGYLGVK